MRRSFTLALWIAALGASGVQAQPQFLQSNYNVWHNFTLMPSAGATNIGIVVFDFRHVWARKGPYEDWAVYPGTQDPDFDPFGTDQFGSPVSQNSGLVVPVNCQYGVSAVDPAMGLHQFDCTDVLTLFPTFATACNEWDIPSYDPSVPQPITGIIRSQGGAQTSLSDTRFSSAYAFSTTEVQMVGDLNLSFGQLTWSTTMDSSAVGGGSGATLLGDPVHFIAENLNSGVVVDAVLLTIDYADSGDGNTTWDAGVFDTDATEVTLNVDIPAAYVAPGQAGRIEFRIQGGVVTVSNASGQFAGLLPPVGTPTPLNFPLPGDFALDYDLGLTPADPWDVRAVLSGGGGAHPELVDTSCPADVDHNGVLNLDDVNGFVGAFIAGDIGVADQNGDGNLNLDDVNAFVMQFVGGCPPVGGEG
ncbi:MAG: GC-type dockerin domain-anchored protein [Phycisphaerales bacterium]